MRYVLSNWKMHTTVGQGRALLEAVQSGLRERVGAGVDLPRVIVCPPSVSLVPLRSVADPGLVSLGAQTCHWEREGPYTGEIAAPMLAGLADYVMVGHRDRRAAGESDEHVARKVAAVVEAGMVPIVFVGEDGPAAAAATAAAGAADPVGEQVRVALSGVDVARQRVLVVYEPAWAIGAEQAAAVDHVGRAVAHLRSVMADLGAGRAAILYGGAVSPGNLERLCRLDGLDGVGATRAGLDPGRFLAIVDGVARVGEGRP